MSEQESLNSNEENMSNNFAGIFCANNTNFSVTSGTSSTGSWICSCGSIPCTCNNKCNTPYVYSSPNRCLTCGNAPCSCYINVPNTITYPWTTTTTTFNIPTDPTAAKLFEMLLQGKDVIEYKEEYIKLIEQLPWVKGNNMQTIAVYERLRRLAKLLGIPIVRKKKVEENKNGESEETKGSKS